MITRPRYNVTGNLERFDERENVQARAELVPGSERYIQFYQGHPGWEKKDQRSRELPGIGRVGNALDIPLLWKQVENLARYGREDVVDGPEASTRQALSPERAAEKIKGFACQLGADLVRIGPLNPAYVYTYVGKMWHDPDRKYGSSITLNHESAINIAMGINPGMIKAGPVLAMISEIMRVYTRLAIISTTLAGYIRTLGYRARAHIISNYRVLCVPLAIDAGMGELGRHGLMITKELGSCLKLTTVSTDLPLIYDPPVDLGVDEFCRDCKICAETCPAGAIPYGNKKVVRGVEKWCINPEACFTIFNETGTDCGVCLASCPWTKPRSGIHRLAVSFATRKKKAGWWMSRAEKFFYGKFRPRSSPSWFEEPDPIWMKYKPLR